MTTQAKDGPKEEYLKPVTMSNIDLVSISAIQPCCIHSAITYIQENEALKRQEHLSIC